MVAPTIDQVYKGRYHETPQAAAVPTAAATGPTVGHDAADLRWMMTHIPKNTRDYAKYDL